jgi:HAE1 family hydrophobic/amphiphilic exporter-1
VATAAIYAGFLLVGAAALPDLPLGLAPDLESPRLAVSWTWRGASPEAMEALVTAPIEAEVARLKGVEELASTSGPGWGWIEVSFARSARVDLAEIVLRERLAVLRADLPVDLDPPQIVRTVPEEMDPGAFFVIRMTGDRTPQVLRRLLEDRVLPRLAAVPGVSGAAAFGGSRPEIRVELDRSPVERGVVDTKAVESALDRIGTRASLGSWRIGEERIPVALERPEVAAAALESRILSARGVPVRLGGVARVREGWEEPRTLSRLDGRPSVQGVLERAAGSNVLKVAAASRRRLEEIRRTLPPGVAVHVVHDESETIREEILVLVRRAVISLVLIFGVLVLSRCSLRVPGVVLGSVLFSAVATFLLFRISGLGLNLVTLSGLALAFGMAVDNSIVLLENVSLRSRGRAHPLRTLAAVREVFFPLLAATATTAVVLTPFLYLEDGLRDYYFPFVLAVVLSLVASLGVALTLTPLLSRWADREGAATSRFPTLRRRAESESRRLGRGYDAVLRTLLRRPSIPAVASLLVLAGSLWIFDEKVSKGSIFTPRADTTLRVAIGMPPGAEITRTDALLRRFEDIALDHEFRRRGWVDQVESFVREDRGFLAVRFHPAVALTAVPVTLEGEMSRQAASVSGADVSVVGQGPGFRRGRSSVSPSYSLRVRGPEYPRLGELAESLADLLRRNPRIREVDTHGAGLFVEDARELVLVPDRSRLAHAGMTVRELVRAIEPAIASEVASRRYARSDGEVTVRIRFAGGDALTPTELMATRIPTRAGGTVPVGELSRIEERSVPGEIRRRDQQYERTISFEYRGPRRVGDRFVRSVVENTDLPPGYVLEDGLGVFLTSREEGEIHRAILFAVVLVGLVSAALFESLMLPLVALLSVPLSFVGIPITFWATGESFDRTAYVGLVLLAGIAINNALLLVHRAGRLRHRLGDARTAARRAARERLRPILLTTATSVAGLAPLAAEGQSVTAGTWRSLALSASAGLIASAAFTLLVIPCLFTLLGRRRHRAHETGRAHPLFTEGETIR